MISTPSLVNLVLPADMTKHTTRTRKRLNLDSQLAQIAIAIKREGLLLGRTDTNLRRQVGAVTLRSGKNLNTNVEEGITIDEPLKIGRARKSRCKPIVLDDLEPDSELPPKKGKPDQTKEVQKPQPVLNDREEESEDEENVNRQTRD
ncbi:hypothetical protein DY000_02049295 [Brassica cretica]|uniref:Uncharacterized protein n=1 Tax=Brassica cretica TaxID=69181 RepID=A0ABQ7F1E4_BRACR|nr:hypothetical protein DY000_02049295 [Brassica cretica]